MYTVSHALLKKQHFAASTTHTSFHVHLNKDVLLTSIVLKVTIITTD